MTPGHLCERTIQDRVRLAHEIPLTGILDDSNHGHALARGPDVDLAAERASRAQACGKGAVDERDRQAGFRVARIEVASFTQRDPQRLEVLRRNVYGDGGALPP